MCVIPACFKRISDFSPNGAYVQYKECSVLTWFLLVGGLYGLELFVLV